MTSTHPLRALLAFALLAAPAGGNAQPAGNAPDKEQEFARAVLDHLGGQKRLSDRKGRALNVAVAQQRLDRGEPVWVTIPEMGHLEPGGKARMYALKKKPVRVPAPFEISVLGRKPDRTVLRDDIPGSIPRRLHRVRLTSTTQLIKANEIGEWTPHGAKRPRQGGAATLGRPVLSQTEKRVGRWLRGKEGGIHERLRGSRARRPSRFRPGRSEPGLYVKRGPLGLLGMRRVDRTEATRHIVQGRPVKLVSPRGSGVIRSPKGIAPRLR